MKSAHDILMDLYHAKLENDAAKKARRKVNWDVMCDLQKKEKWHPGYELCEPESKEAHALVSETSHRQGAAMRAVMKYGREHENSTCP